MKYASLEKSREQSSIAWFKLAEVITRGEKERALSIYRLLMHSISDDAIKAQLEGDILRIFNDPAAVHSYGRAAQLYQKNNEVMQASLLYEQLVVGMLTAQDSYDTVFLQQSIVAVLRGYQSQVCENSYKTARFLAKLAALDEKVYAYACEQVLIL